MKSNETAPVPAKGREARRRGPIFGEPAACMPPTPRRAGTRIRSARLVVGGRIYAGERID